MDNKKLLHCFQRFWENYTITRYQGCVNRHAGARSSTKSVNRGLESSYVIDCRCLHYYSRCSDEIPNKLGIFMVQCDASQDKMESVDLVQMIPKKT